MTTLTIDSADLIELLECAFGGEHERALMLADRAGVRRLELAMLRLNATPEDEDEGTFDDGYQEGWEDALVEAAHAVEDVTIPRRQPAKKAS